MTRALRYFPGSSRLYPSGARTIAMSQWTPSSPVHWSAKPPRTSPRPLHGVGRVGGVGTVRDADTAAGLGEMLRSLKERAGLSYGALAGRLHLSTSTLHRYCTGTSVPAEFAPVERFGRICRADPEELLELHRRWAVADEARRGRGASPSEGAEVPVPAPAPVVQSPPTVAEPTRRARQLVSRYVLLGAAVVALSTSGALAIDRFRAESVPDLTVPAIMAPDPSTEEAGRPEETSPSRRPSSRPTTTAPGRTALGPVARRSA